MTFREGSPKATVPDRLLRSLGNSWLGAAALILFGLVAYLPGISVVPPLDGDEARYAEASRAMLSAEGWEDYVVPHIGSTPRINKPPLVYWVQAASASVFAAGRPGAGFASGSFGEAAHSARLSTGSSPVHGPPFAGAIAAYRLPSVLATIGALLITWRLGVAMFSPACGWLAAVLLGCSYIVLVDARLARTDQLLLAFTCATQWALYHVWRRDPPRGRYVVVFWLALTAGAMTKGPVTPGVALLSALSLGLVTRKWAWMRRLHPIAGCAFVVAIMAGWVVTAAWVIGGAEVSDAVLRETLLRGVEATSGRAGPPGYHLVLLYALFWPGSLLMIPGFLYALRRAVRWNGLAVAPRRRRHFRFRNLSRIQARRRPELFCLAWIVPAWILCELAETKLPHYTLPLYPPIALLTARVAFAGAKATVPIVRSRATILGDAIWALVGGLLLVAIPVFMIRLGGIRREPGLFLALIAYTIVLAALLWGSWMVVRRKRFAAGLILACFGSLIGVRGLFQTALPNLTEPWLSSRVVHVLAEVDPEGCRPLAAAGFDRESLLFLTGGRAERISPDEVEWWFANHPEGVVVVPEDDLLVVHDMEQVSSVSGFDFVEGRHVELAIVERLHFAR